MRELPFDPTLYWLFNFHCLIGGIAAVIANRKGYALIPWLLWGLIGGTFTFIVALRLQAKSS
jgi:hypothetical protein